MLGREKSLDMFDTFISITKEIAKLPALVLLQYQVSDQDIYQICQKLFAANEHLSRWLHRFIYVDFRQQNARTEFMKALLDEVIERLDSFLTASEQHVDSNELNNAEEDRLKFKADSKDITAALAKFSGELSDLVIKFAQIARVVVTLG